MVKYWDSVKNYINGLSKELKDLYIQMISFKPKERPIIKQIFSSEWMKEIREMNDKQLAQLENEIKEEFLKREPLVIEGLKKKTEAEKENSNELAGEGVSIIIKNFLI